MYLALVYRYLLKDVGRAIKFYDLAKGIKMLPRTHPIAEHCQLFQRIQDDNIKSGDSFHNLLYVTKRRVDDIKLEIRVLRSGDNLLISGQLWDRVRKKREELAKAGKNNLRYAIRGIKEYRRIVMAKEVKRIQKKEESAKIMLVTERCSYMEDITLKLEQRLINEYQESKNKVNFVIDYKEVMDIRNY